MKRIFTVANLIFITLAIYFAVNGFYRVMAAKMDHMDLSAPARKPIVTSKVEATRPLSYYNTIIERNLFNIQKTPEKKSEKVDIEGLKQTELNLKLWGTVTGDEEKAYAVIEDTKTRKQNLYRIGDAIQQATVKMILRQKVVLRVDDRDEILEMAEAKTTRKDSRRSSRSFGRAKTPVATAGPGSTQKISLKRSQVDDALKDINDLMGQVKIRPHFKDGKPDGLMLSSIKTGSIFKKMGLRNGDIITGVDGQVIESVDDALKFYENLASAANVNLEIKRRGRPKSIEYTFD
jgi:general secretion pathway protein C